MLCFGREKITCKPCNAPVNGATLQRRIPRHTPSRPLHLPTIVIFVVTVANVVVVVVGGDVLVVCRVFGVFSH